MLVEGKAGSVYCSIIKLLRSRLSMDICYFSNSGGYHFLWFLGHGNSKCQKKLCECDGVAARCFKSHFSKLQDRYINYDKSKC